MKLNHVNLTVNDVQAARAFLEKHFGCARMARARRTSTFSSTTTTWC
jgi:catechol 2,3-dioxygenase-like lactoylglutathione lyase family enzyme